MKTLWSRKARTITEVETGKRRLFDSINLAKKESVKLQKSEGGLGMGSMVVAK